MKKEVAMLQGLKSKFSQLLTNITISLFLLPSSGLADDWMLLPDMADTSIYVLGSGISPLGGKVGPCVLPTGRTRDVIGRSFIKITIQDYGKDRSFSESKSQSVSVEGSARFGVGGGSAKYSSTKSTKTEQTNSSRSVDVVLEAYNDTFSESGSSYELTNQGKAFLEKSQAEFMDKCGALIAVEITKAVSVKAVLTITFDSETDRRALSERMTASADGSYGAFSAKASTTTELDKVLSEARYGYNIQVDVTSKGDRGLQGYAELAKQLENKSDPFKSAVSSIAALLSAVAGDNGAPNKIKFAPIDNYVSELNVLPWEERSKFWERASRVYLTLLGLEEIRRIQEEVNRPSESFLSEDNIGLAAWNFLCSGPPPPLEDEELPHFTPSYLSFGALRDNIIVHNRCELGDVDLLEQKVKLKSLIAQCLGASDAGICDLNGILIAVLPVYRDIYNKPISLNSFNPGDFVKFIDSYPPTKNNDGSIYSPFNDLSNEEKNVAISNFIMLSDLKIGYGRNWSDSDRKEFNNFTNYATHRNNVNIEEVMRDLDEDVDSFLNTIHSTDIKLSTVIPSRYATWTDEQFSLTPDSVDVLVRHEGIFYIDKFFVESPDGSSYTIDYDYISIPQFGGYSIYWSGPDDFCGTPPCGSGQMIQKWINNFRATSVARKTADIDLYVVAQTIDGPVTKYIRTYSPGTR